MAAYAPKGPGFKSILTAATGATFVGKLLNKQFQRTQKHRTDFEPWEAEAAPKETGDRSSSLPWAVGLPVAGVGAVGLLYYLLNRNKPEDGLKRKRKPRLPLQTG